MTTCTDPDHAGVLAAVRRIEADFQRSTGTNLIGNLELLTRSTSATLH